MQPFDPNTKRRADQTGTQIGHIRLLPGSGADRLAKTIGGYVDKQVAATNASIAAGTAERQARADQTGKPVYDGAGGVLAKPSVVRLTTALHNPVESPVGGGDSTPAGGVPASPRPVARPSFAGVQGKVVTPPQPQTTGITRSVVNGVPTFTGTGDYAPDKVVNAPAAAVTRPAFTDPRIAPVQTPGVTNQSETTDQRRARESAISEIGTQLFLNRGKTTRSARDLTGDLLKTQADLTNTAGNQAVALKNANLDAQTRLDAVALQNQGENDRARIAITGANEQVAYAQDADTNRERLKLAKPETQSGADGSLLSVTGTLARPVLNLDGTRVRVPRPGEITPTIALDSTQNELAAAQQSLTPNPDRIGALQREIDALRRPNAGPLPGDVVDGFQFRGGDPRLKANWERLGGGAP